MKDPSIFTRVKLIDSNMLTIPGVMAAISVVYILRIKMVTSKREKKNFVRKTIPKWITSFLLFYTVYIVDNKVF